MNTNQTNEQTMDTAFERLIYNGVGTFEFEHNKISYSISPNIKIQLPTDNCFVAALKAQNILVKA